MPCFLGQNHPDQNRCDSTPLALALYSTVVPRLPPPMPTGNECAKSGRDPSSLALPLFAHSFPVGGGSLCTWEGCIIMAGRGEVEAAAQTGEWV